MADIATINGVPIADVNNVLGVPKASISNIWGIDIPASGTNVYRSMIVTTSPNAANSATGYVTPGGVWEESSTLATQEIRIPRNGWLRNIRCYNYANAATTTTTIRLIVNGNTTSASFTISSAATGFFEDTTNTVAVSAGDLITFEIVRGDSGVINFTHIAIDYLTPKGSSLLASVAQGTFSTASATRWFRISGSAAILTSSSIASQASIPSACTARNFGLYVTTNGRTTDTTFELLKNGTSSATITVPSSTTGWVLNTSTTFSVAVGDTLEWRITTSTGSETITWKNVIMELEPDTAGVGNVISAFPSGSMNTTTRGAHFGAGAINFTSNSGQNTRFRTVIRGSGTISRMYLGVSSNTQDVDNNYVLQYNGTSSSLTVTAPSVTTGLFTDLSNSYSYSAGEQIHIRIDRIGTPTVGTHTIGWLTFRIEPAMETI